MFESFLELGVGGIFAIMVLWVVFQFILKWRENGNGKNGKKKLPSDIAQDIHETKEIAIRLDRSSIGQHHCLESMSDNMKGMSDDMRDMLSEQRETNSLLRDIKKNGGTE
jgi:hypothetical protein